MGQVPCESLTAESAAAARVRQPLSELAAARVCLRVDVLAFALNQAMFLRKLPASTAQWSCCTQERFLHEQLSCMQGRINDA
jgi:hypothetical protein